MATKSAAQATETHPLPLDAARGVTGNVVMVDDVAREIHLVIEMEPRSVSDKGNVTLATTGGNREIFTGVKLGVNVYRQLRPGEVIDGQTGDANPLATVKSV